MGYFNNNYLMNKGGRFVGFLLNKISLVCFSFGLNYSVIVICFDNWWCFF